MKTWKFEIWKPAEQNGWLKQADVARDFVKRQEVPISVHL